MILLNLLQPHRFRLFILLTLCGAISGCSPRLRTVEQQLSEVRRELDTMGKPLISQTAPEFGYMTMPNFAWPELRSNKPSGARWVQVDLGVAQRLDQIALIPAQMDWQVVSRPNYNFPVRFEVALSDDPAFFTSTAVASFLNQDFPNPGITPVVMSAQGKTARYVRLTVHQPDNFALAELMVLSGNRNIAIGCPVSTIGSAEAPPRWSPQNLVDGRTPLGPPIVDEDHFYDGVYAGPAEGNLPVWMQVDLGRTVAIEEVRLHPVHGRHGLDIPGYRFPSSFRVEISDNAEFTSSQLLFESVNFSLPGNNAVTLPAANIRGRYVKITVVSDEAEGVARRFGLSEIEVYSGGHNVAPGATLSRTQYEDPKRKDWPEDLLFDGYTSFGKIVELPVWLANWTRRRELALQLDALQREQVALLAEVSQQQWVLVGMLGTLFAGAIAGVVLRMRQLRVRALDQYRKELAHDLHDEIGSNLAAIGIISETGATVPSASGAEFCREINQIALETTQAMREVLWLTEFKVKTGVDFMKDLRATAARILTGRKVEWITEVEALPEGIRLEDRRQIFLFFKEALANIVRHSEADAVTLTARVDAGHFLLEIRDNGRGFEVESWSGGIGLASLRNRAARLGGTVQIETAPENGTRVILKTRL